MDAIITKQIDISSIDTSPMGIAHNGKHIFMTGTQNNRIYQLDLDGKKIRTIDQSAVDAIPQGIMTWDRYLVFGGLGNNRIIVIDYNAKLICMANSVVTPRSITTDGKYIWYLNDADDYLYMSRFSKGQKAEIKKFPGAGNDQNPQGITFDGKNLWVSTSYNDFIYCFDRNGTIIREVNISGIDILPRDIVHDGKNIWMIGIENTSIYQLRV